MKKGLLYRLSAVLLIAIMLSGCAEGTKTPGTVQPADGVKLWWAYNTENFMQDTKYDLDRDSTLRMEGIRGDVESVQLMVTPEKDVVSFDFTMGDVKSESGAVISADCFEVFAEYYLDVEASYNPDSFFGYYPDALIPIDKYKFRRQNFIDAGENQGIWINVNIAKDAAAGTYKGSGTLDLDGKTYSVPVELKVYDVEMPEEVHAETCYLIWYNHIAYTEKTSSPELDQAYFDFLVSKRISPMSPGSAKTTDYNVYVDYVASDLAENPKISAYGLPYSAVTKDGVNHLNKNNVLDLLNKMVDKNIALRKAGNKTIDLFKKAYYYLGSICDEPSTPEAFAIVRESDLMITEAKNEVAKRLNDYPDLKDSLLSLRHLVTSRIVDELVGSDTVGGVQTWCPTFENFNTKEQRDAYKARQNTKDRLKGENVWWYGCLNPRAPYPTYHLDDHLLSSRVIGWMQYDYGIEGELYWAINNAQFKGVIRDVWTDPQSRTQTPGDGYLVYPGREYGIKGPISTLRLESIRESKEDYEYFWMFDQKIQEYNKKNGTKLDTNALLQTYFNGLYEGTIPKTDTKLFAERRTELLKTLESLYSDLDGTVAKLTK